ncbi:MAG: DUF4393 domain-containing protein [Eubacteriales bacterium]|nr:DUF4393 domain-containing protein [Eubacteriales bacterium]
MFEEQIITYLQSYEMKSTDMEELSGRIGRRLTEQPCMPDSRVAGNCMLQYSWADEKQREAYAALLAADMDEKTKTQVHPAFVSIISQMDETDMLLLNRIREQRAMPIADCYLSRMKKSGSFSGKTMEDMAGSMKLIMHMTTFLPTDGDYEHVQAAIDNLLRLHLIEIHMQEERHALEEIQENEYEDIYMLFQQIIEETVTQLCSRYPECRERRIRLHTGNISFTAFGSRFLRVCGI